MNKKLKIFIASPNDVLSERQHVRDVVKTINYWAVFAKIEFHVVDWENNTYPSIGDYPQDAINKQIGEYDILIGIFWSRVGTETPHFLSGTIEEIERAYLKAKKKKNIDLMIYFKSDIVPDSIFDKNQFDKMQLFKSSIKDRILYWDFKSEEFKNTLSVHLALLVQHKYWKESNESQNLECLDINDTVNRKSAKEYMLEASSCLSDIHEIISLLTAFHKNEEDADNAEINQLKSLSKLSISKENAILYKKMMEKFSLRILNDDMILKNEINDLNASFNRLFNSLSLSLILKYELNSQELVSLKNFVDNQFNLNETYLSIYNSINERLIILKSMIKSNNFPVYNRAVKIQVATYFKYRDSIKIRIQMVNELKKFAISQNL